MFHHRALLKLVFLYAFSHPNYEQYVTELPPTDNSFRPYKKLPTHKYEIRLPPNTYHQPLIHKLAHHQSATGQQLTLDKIKYTMVHQVFRK